MSHSIQFCFFCRTCNRSWDHTSHTSYICYASRTKVKQIQWVTNSTSHVVSHEQSLTRLWDHTRGGWQISSVSVVLSNFFVKSWDLDPTQFHRMGTCRHPHVNLRKNYSKPPWLDVLQRPQASARTLVPFMRFQSSKWWQSCFYKAKENVPPAIKQYKNRGNASNLVQSHLESPQLKELESWIAPLTASYAGVSLPLALSLSLSRSLSLKELESWFAPLVPREFYPKCWGLNQPPPSRPNTLYSIHMLFVTNPYTYDKSRTKSHQIMGP